jgi:preprotein translocase subunit SecA
MRRLKGERRENAIRARVEQILRSELVWFEQTVLLQVIDPLWKDHLYAMDQLRDSINYRAYSQQDPRIEYKREGARLFREFEDRIRERVTEYVFRARVMPQVGPPPGQRPGAQRRPAPAGIAAAAAPAPRPAPAPAQAFGGGTITGPGLDRPPV